jgi:hypothetical protein
MDSAYKGYQSTNPNAPYYRAPEKPKTLVPDALVLSFKPEDLLEERGHTHGEYKETARIAQFLKAFFHDERGWRDLNNAQKEAIDMTCTKFARILEGDQNARQHWEDVAGYSALIVNMLNEKVPSL